MSPGDARRPGEPDPGEPPLTDAEIEALLAQEGHAAPEAGAPAPQPQVVRREPGQTRVGAVLVWLVIAFLVASLVQSLR